ncbi:MAG: glycoside hydrolase family 1 protein [Candidatus Doudnabacteria bacterium]|nr:glycoside hydrolase family 1 protein [Candidatus Doudnabacteria bacterium]
MPKVRIRFPENFLWGAASSAYQTEGNNINADWWVWEHSEKRKRALKGHQNPYDQYICGVGTDFYNRYEEDFSLAAHLSHNAVRFGVEWSRIEPMQGKFDQKVLDHYEKILQSAKANGLQVFLTLHHFTLPTWLAKRGGFTTKAGIQFYLRYAEIVVKRLGQYVDFWLTFNEPEVYATHSYLLGIFPPQQKNLLSAWRVVNNIIAAHNLISPKIKYITAKPVSMAFHLADLQPTGLLGSLARSFSHYLANEYILRRTINACDFVGVNYYEHFHVSILGRRKSSHSGHESTDLGWSIHPEGIERVLLNVQKYNKPIYITENGLADHKDVKREKFIKDHLYYVHEAIKKGANVRGYLHWSLTDNFEWQHGYWPRFGLIEIDRENMLRRKARYSALMYAQICKDNYFDYEVK